MLNCQIEFEINQGQINRFLIGSKSFFSLIEKIVDSLALSINVEVEIKSSLAELESKKIIYNLEFYINYPIQRNLGVNIDNRDIETWFFTGLSLFFESDSTNILIYELDNLAEKLKISSTILYIKISEKKMKNLLDDLKNLSILLFNKLVFSRKEG
ncbi:hypothetical protein JW865_03005 [Candidatus Bathyarchaeota archaeon]|nr:hypothetical protein [Candidatus Bathyarchaeota archaeon]MBN2617128.1 hypothetical protein [Spirochaetales bacterium]